MQLPLYWHFSLLQVDKTQSADASWIEGLLLNKFICEIILYIKKISIDTFLVSCGKTRLHSNQNASLALMERRSTSWKERRSWHLALESDAALARSSHEMKSFFSWQSLSRGFSSVQNQESCWTWPPSMGWQWSTNGATYRPPWEQEVNCKGHSHVRSQWKKHFFMNVGHRVSDLIQNSCQWSKWMKHVC